MKTFIKIIMSSALFTPVLALANGGDEYGHMMDWGGGMMSGGIWGSLAFLTWLVWLVVGILVIVWLWKQINDK